MRIRALPVFAGIVTLFAGCASLFYSGGSDADWKEVPVVFEGDRPFLQLRKGSQTFSLLLDSGGALDPFVFEDSAKSLGVIGTTTGLGSFPELDNEKELLLLGQFKGRTRILPISDGDIADLKISAKDGVIGAAFLADRVWRLDYLRNRVFYTSKISQPLKQVPAFLGFRLNARRRTSHQPRIPVNIQGNIYQMLFDTGATSFYSEPAMKSAGLINSPVQASSFIRQSVFDKWRKKHPEWRVVMDGDKFSQGENLIEVSEIIIGGQKVGPVWFATRKDKFFEKYSHEFMDQKIDGAIGGNVFRGFRITIDYPNATAWFER